MCATKFSFSLPLIENEHQDAILMLEAIQRRLLQATKQNIDHACHMTKMFQIDLLTFETHFLDDMESLTEFTKSFEAG